MEGLASGELLPVMVASKGGVGHVITPCVVVFHHCNSPHRRLRTLFFGGYRASITLGVNTAVRYHR
jgi:hypothetical protein